MADAPKTNVQAGDDAPDSEEARQDVEEAKGEADVPEPRASMEDAEFDPENMIELPGDEDDSVVGVTVPTTAPDDDDTDDSDETKPSGKKARLGLKDRRES